MIKMVVLLGLVMISNSALWAGTIVKMQNKDEFTSIIADGHLARLQMPDAEYAIVDYKKNKVKIVNPTKKQVTVLTIKNINPRNDSNAVNISINKLGAGEVVAGYETQKYRYFANGKMCGVIYGSQAAYESQGIKELFSAVKILMKKQYALLGGFASLVDVCTLADMQVGKYVATIGVPMRTEKNGSIESEVISIKIDVSLPADVFTIPAAYKTITM